MYLTLLLYFFGFFCSGNAIANSNANLWLPIDIDFSEAIKPVWSDLRVIAAKNKDTKISEIVESVKNGDYLVVNSSSQIFGRGTTPYWGYFQLINTSEQVRHKLLVLEATTWFDIQVFEKDILGNWVEKYSWERNVDGRIGAGTIYPVWSVELDQYSMKEMLIKIEGPSIVRFPIYLYSLKDFALTERILHFIIGIIFGLFVFLGSYILLIHRNLNGNSPKLFILILVSNLIGALWISGVLREVFPGASEFIHSAIGFGSYCILFSCASYHIRLILKDDIRYSIFDRLLYILSIFWISISFWLSWVDPVAARVILVWGGAGTGLVALILMIRERASIKLPNTELAMWMFSVVLVLFFLASRMMNSHFFWLSSSIALFQASLLAVLYGVSLNRHLMNQSALAKESENKALLENEAVKIQMKERNLIYGAIAHDLRQPLLGINVFADLMRKSQSKEKQLQIAERLNMALNEANDILVTMQHLATLNNSDVLVKMEVTSIDQILQPLIEEYRFRAASKKINIRYVPSVLKIKTYIPYFQRIVRNALANSVLHGGYGCRILVGIRRGGGIRLVIADTGRGMNDERFAIVSKAFNDSNGPDANTEQVGLGLFSSQSLASSIGLSIDFRSSENLGTVFVIKIPVEMIEIHS